jgi:O-ureido-D-serine cyclo-ligase
LSNPAAVVRWNTDKHYLLDLALAGVPTVFSRFVEPGSNACAGLDGFLAQLEEPELVVKPAVGAGSRDTHRYKRQSRDAALTHVRQLLDAGRSVLLQPYLGRVDECGETALIFYAGLFEPTAGTKPAARGGASDVLRFDHAIRKGPMLPGPRSEPVGPEAGGSGARPLFVAEHITRRTAQPDELEVAARTLAAIPHEGLLYARVDLIRDAANRPVLLELELTEPSLFFAHSPGSAERLARAVLDRTRSFPL